MFAVTVLTSLTDAEIGAAWGRTPPLDLGAEVERLAAVAAAAGVDGVVCSGREAARVRARFGSRLGILVPGVRAAGGAHDDQARVATPREAASAGADYIVVGRLVTSATDRRAAMDRVIAEVA